MASSAPNADMLKQQAHLVKQLASSDELFYQSVGVLLSSYQKSAEERTPLLDPAEPYGDAHEQFCILVGIPPSDSRHRGKKKLKYAGNLYTRAKALRKSSNMSYYFSAALSHTLMLTQIIVSAAVLALAASTVTSRVLIIVFAAANTAIAALIAFLKTQGQPARAKVFRDDIEHVVQEIEASEIMWLGISANLHGYESVMGHDDEEVSVQAEVARLTALLEKAVRDKAKNSPETFAPGGHATENVRSAAADFKSKITAAAKKKDGGNLLTGASKAGSSGAKGKAKAGPSATATEINTSDNQTNSETKTETTANGINETTTKILSTSMGFGLNDSVAPTTTTGTDKTKA